MNKNIILIIVALAMFMEALDTTIINTAIPSMANSLQVNPIDLKIALISYLLSLAVFIPISGWVADKFGAKKTFIFAIGVFTLSSIWCGTTSNLTELVIARIIQGLGGSLTMPVGRLIIVRTCERHELISKMSIVVMVAALGMMLGPLLGGVITTHFSWRWIFWVNIPIGILAIISAHLFFPEMPSFKVPTLDKLGFILFGSGLAAMTFGLSLLSESGVNNTLAVIIILSSIGLFFLYAIHSRRKPHPIVRVQLLKYRTFRISVIGNLFARIGFGGVPFLVPLLLQIALGYSPQISGLLLAPTALGVFLVKPLSLYILRFFGYKNLLILNTFLVGLSLISFAYVTADTSFYIIAFLTFIYGFLIALQYTGMNSIAYAKISNTEYSSATSIMSTVQQLAQSIGVAIAALFVRLFAAPSGNEQLSQLVFHHTFITMGMLTFLSGTIFLFLKPKDGHELIDKPNKAISSTSQI